MSISNSSLNKKLYSLLKTQGYDPIPKDSKGNTTPVPDEADVFKFTFKDNGKPVGPAWITIDSNQDLKVYYDDKVMSGVSEGEDVNQIDSFPEFLKQLKMWAQHRQLGFDLENQDHLSSDMAQREYVKMKENIKEGYYPMGKSASYNDSVPSVKIVLQHTRQIQEGEQRFRNIARIFLENAQGERILAPTTRPGIAQVYARHLAEGGVPNDERWNHIKSLCEEYQKMAGFVRAVRSSQFNESAQPLVEAGLNHYTSLRETLGKMRGHRGYNTYFESWTPALMETEGDETNLNELFVQETLDPRIESVMPILSRIHKKVNEMSEVQALEEWADEIISEKMVMGSGSDASSSGSYKMGEATDLKSIPEKVEDLDEDELPVVPKSKVPAALRKQKGGDWKVSTQDLEKEKERNISGAEGLAALKKRLGQLSEEQVDEDLGPEQKRVGQLGPTEKITKSNPLRGKLVGANESIEQGVAEGLGGPSDAVKYLKRKWHGKPSPTQVALNHYADAMIHSGKDDKEAEKHRNRFNKVQKLNKSIGKYEGPLPHELEEQSVAEGMFDVVKGAAKKVGGAVTGVKKWYHKTAQHAVDEYMAEKYPGKTAKTPAEKDKILGMYILDKGILDRSELNNLLPIVAEYGGLFKTCMDLKLDFNSSPDGGGSRHDNPTERLHWILLQHGFTRTNAAMPTKTPADAAKIKKNAEAAATKGVAEDTGDEKFDTMMNKIVQGGRPKGLVPIKPGSLFNRFHDDNGSVHSTEQSQSNKGKDVWIYLGPPPMLSSPNPEYYLHTTVVADEFSDGDYLIGYKDKDGNYRRTIANRVFVQKNQGVTEGQEDLEAILRIIRK